MAQYLENVAKKSMESQVFILDNGYGGYIIKVTNAALVYPDFAGTRGKFANGVPHFGVAVNKDLVDAINQVVQHKRDTSGNQDVSFKFHTKPIYTEDEIQNKGAEPADILYIDVKVNLRPRRNKNNEELPFKYFLHCYDDNGNLMRPTRLTDKTFCTLNGVEIEKVDLSINLFVSEQMPDKCTAYLDEIHVIQKKLSNVFPEYMDIDDDPEAIDLDDINRANNQ